MGKKWWMRFILVSFLVIVSVLYLTPSCLNVKNLPQWVQYIVPKEKLKLGLDLQGGLHIVMGIDPQKVLTDGADVLVEDLKTELQKDLKNITITREKNSADLHIQFNGPDDGKAIRKTLLRYSVFEILKNEPTEIWVGFNSQERAFRIKRAVDQSIEAIRNRIDEFGVSEPAIQAEGTDRIIIQFPGIQDTARAKDLIGRTAKLEFKLVDESKNQKELADFVAQIEKEKGIKYEVGTKQKFSDYSAAVNDALSSKLPKETEISFEKETNPQTQKVMWLPYLLKKKADVTGDYISDARVATDPQTNEPVVILKFSAQGTKPFATVTEQNIGKRLAIVLDGLIHSAPVIQSKIPNGEARITFGSSEDPQKLFKDAQDTALVLRAGALPTTIELLEERTVGPSLGADSIAYGKKAIMIAVIAVVLFMMIYYKTSGVIANLALVLNILFILAIMAMFGATLTLPGLAGIVLTIGMAVDANVLIYERIREEIRLHKSAKSAIDAGFEKAWGTILDSNLTTVMAALALLAEGTGPVKGFAVTLTIGICCSMFTAVVVSKLCFDYLLTKFNIQKVSI